MNAEMSFTQRRKVAKITKIIRGERGDTVAPVARKHITQRRKVAKTAKIIRSARGDTVAPVAGKHITQRRKVVKMAEIIRGERGDTVAPVARKHITQRRKVAKMVEIIRSARGDTVAPVAGKRLTQRRKGVKMAKIIRGARGDTVAPVAGKRFTQRRKGVKKAKIIRGGRGDTVASVARKHITQRRKVAKTAKIIRGERGDTVAPVAGKHITQRREGAKMAEIIRSARGDTVAPVAGKHITQRRKVAKTAEIIRSARGDTVAPVARKPFLNLLLSCLTLFPAMTSYAQTQSLSMQVLIHPPYSPYLDQMRSQAVITFNNPTDQSFTLYLQAKISNGSKYIQTKKGVYSDRILVPARHIVTLNNISFNYASFLGANVIDDNLTDAELNTVYGQKILPEGVYNFCVYVFTKDPAGGSYTAFPVNNMPPGQGQCAPFSVFFAQPPVITSPIDKAQIDKQSSPVINFSWIPAAHTIPGSRISYDLYLVKVNDGDDPKADMQNAFTYHSHYYVKIPDIKTNSYVFNTKLNSFKLDAGQRYAVMVQAKDARGRSFFTNEGKSEVITFNTGVPPKTAAAGTGLALKILTPSRNEDTLVVSPRNDLYLNWGYLLNNQLFDPDTVTAFKDKHIASYRVTLLPAAHKKSGRDIDEAFSYQASKKIAASAPKVVSAYLQKTESELKSAGAKGNYWYRFRVEALNGSNRVVDHSESGDFCLSFKNPSTGPVKTVRGQLRYRFDGYAESYPVPNTSLRFYPAAETSPQPGDIYTVTDASGNFKAGLPSGNDISYKMEIESPYYKQVDTMFHIAGDEGSFQLGQLITKVYNYSLTLEVEKKFGNYTVTEMTSSVGNAMPHMGKVLIGIPDSLIKGMPAGVEVMIYRKKRPAFLPPEEGDMIHYPANPDGSIPVCEGKTALKKGKDGKQQAYVKFKRLICNMLPGDVYYIKAIDPGKGSKATQPFQDGPFTAPEKELVFQKPVPADTTHFDVDSLYALISTDPPKSVIKGQLVYRWPGDPDKTLRPLANEKFSIVVEYLYNGKLLPTTVFHQKNGASVPYYAMLTLDGQDHPVSQNAGTVMATGTTDANGYFTVQAVNLNPKGVLGRGKETDVEYPKQPFTEGILKNQEFINPATLSEMNMSPQVGGGNVMDQQHGGIMFNYSGNMDAAFGRSVQTNILNSAMNPGVMGGGPMMMGGAPRVGIRNNGYPRRYIMEGALAAGHGPFFLPGFRLQSPVSDTIPSPASAIYRAGLINGTIQRVYRIKVNDQDIYYNPDKNIVVQPLQATDAGQITVMVKEVKWDLTTEDNGTHNKVPGLEAVVFRDPASKVPHLPQGEGDGEYRVKALINPQLSSAGKTSEQAGNNAAVYSKTASIASHDKEIANQWYANINTNYSGKDFRNGASSFPKGNYEWLENGVTDQQGHIVFNRLLSGFADYYAELASNPQAGHVLFYQAHFPSLNAVNNKNALSYKNDISPGSNCSYGNYWDTRQTDIPVAQMTVEMIPKPSRLGGRVIDKSTGLGIKNALVTIVSNPIPGISDTKESKETNPFGLFQDNDKPVSNTPAVIKRNCITDENGYFESLDLFKGIPENVTNITVKMTASAPGYTAAGQKQGTVSRTGKQYVDDILMVPGAQIIGKVTDEDGNPVDAYIKEGNGKAVSTWKPSGMLDWGITSSAASRLVMNAATHTKQSSGAGSVSSVASPAVMHTTPHNNNASAKGQSAVDAMLNSPKQMIPSTNPETAGGFSIRAPYGKPATLYIIPKDVGYFPDTITLATVKQGVNDLHDKVVFRRKHRMKFVIRDSATDQPVSRAALFISKTQHTLTDAAGAGLFDFENVSVDNYTLKITGPEGQGYVPRLISLHNRESKDPRTYRIKLYKGASVSGVVTLDGKPVEHAKIYLDYKAVSSKDAVPEIAAYSDAAGHYVLNSIPVAKGSVNIVATLDTSFTVAGDRETVTLNGGGAVQNLALISYHQMLIKSLYGFPLSVESIQPASAKGQVKVTGEVDISKGVSDFGFTTGTNSHVRVSDVLYTAKQVSGKTVGVPVANNVSMDATAAVKLSYQDKYNVLLTANGQDASTPQLLQISADKTVGGAINGYINIVDNSFNYPSTYLNFTEKDQFYFCKTSGSQIKNKLDVIQAAGKAPHAQYHLCNLDKKPIRFRFIEFDATADPLNSYIDHAGKIHLDVSMRCDIPHAEPEHFDVHAGDIVLDNNKVYPGTDTAALSVKLEKWTLQVRHWSIDPQKGGIYATDGLIKTGKLDIPFSEFNLRADMLVMDQFHLDKLELGGGVKQLDDISQKNALLVFDTHAGSDMSGHWKLAVAGTDHQPAAKIKGLSYNGRQYLNRDINIDYIQLLSNGEDIFSVQQGDKPMLINQNGVAQFSPQSISSGPDFFKITGGLHIPAPRVVPFMTTLQFSGSPAALKMKIVPVQMSFEGKGYVNFFANEKVAPIITHDQIVMAGNVQEKEGFNPITATFYADGNSPAKTHYHVDLKKDFILNLTSKAPNGGTAGKYNLKLNDGGGMEVPEGGNDWNLLSFSGHLLTDDNTLKAKGGQGNSMKFTVTGDVDVNGDSAKVSNIDLPFGHMHMAYIFSEKRLVGNLHVDSIKLGTFKISGDVEMLMEPAGWYFLGSCMINTGIPGPFSSVNMGFLLGNHGFNAPDWEKIKDVVGQYAFDKSSLCWLRNNGSHAIKGVFITAGKDLVHTSIGVDAGVASFYLKARAGGEASLYASFNPLWEIQLSAGLYGQVTAGATVLAVSVNGDLQVKGSMTGALGGAEDCIGGKMSASLSAQGKVSLPTGDISFGPLRENAVLKFLVSNISGVSTDFYFGQAPPPTCGGKSACSN